MYLIHLYPFLLLKWKSLNGSNCKYLINKNGYLICLQKKGSNKFLKSRIDRAGYSTVRLNKNGQSSTQFVHRLLAAAFIPNPKNKPFINHINGIKIDNRLENLEWVTHAENIKHAYKTGLINKSKSVVDNCTGKTFKNSKEASCYLGINQSTLKSYLNGNIKKNPTCLQYMSAA